MSLTGERKKLPKRCGPVAVKRIQPGAPLVGTNHMRKNQLTQGLFYRCKANSRHWIWPYPQIIDDWSSYVRGASPICTLTAGDTKTNFRTGTLPGTSGNALILPWVYSTDFDTIDVYYKIASRYKYPIQVAALATTLVDSFTQVESDYQTVVCRSMPLDAPWQRDDRGQGLRVAHGRVSIGDLTPPSSGIIGINLRCKIPATTNPELQPSGPTTTRQIVVLLKKLIVVERLALEEG